MNNKDLISIVIPVYNAGNHLKTCLESINSSSYPHYEVIVVDDSSTDDSAYIARKEGFHVLQLPKHSGPKGPAFARNYGVQKACGKIIVFIDSDVVLHQETLHRIAANFKDTSISALFGSYDDRPAFNNFISQYKNLFHHFIHQHSNSNSNSFWTGCGAIRREVFLKAGGFDEKTYKRPSIEDIEFGIRLKRMGYKILLDKNVQVKHLKKWNFWSLIKTDIFDRAVPWIKLIINSKSIPSDLNLKYSYRMSAVLVALLAAMSTFLLLGHKVLLFVPIKICLYAIVVALFITSVGIAYKEFHSQHKKGDKTSIIHKTLLLLIICLFAACSVFLLLGHFMFCFIPILYLFYAATAMMFFCVLILNRQIYSFLAKKKGVRFVMFAIPFHFFYYFYSLSTFIICWPIFKVSSIIVSFKRTNRPNS